MALHACIAPEDRAAATGAEGLGDRVAGMRPVLEFAQFARQLNALFGEIAPTVWPAPLTF